MSLSSTLASFARRTVPLSVGRRVQRMLRPEPRFDLRMTLASGGDLCVGSPSQWSTFSEVFVNGEYDGPIAEALAGRPSDRTLRVLDVGANVGYFTARLFDLARQQGLTDTDLEVVLFEGSPTTAEVLDGYLRAGAAPTDRVRLVRGLVGRRDGVGHMTQHRYSGMSNILSGSALATRVSFVDIEAEIGDGPVDLFKCDVEGAEEMVLETYPELLRRTERAVFEFHPQLCDVDRCKRLLREAGLTDETVHRVHPEFEVASYRR